VIARLPASFSRARRDSVTSSSATGSPVRIAAPGRFKSRSSFASTGLESARSISGTTVPDAVMTASMAPDWTIAVRMRVRSRVGRIHPGSRVSTMASAARGSATFTAPRSRLRRRSVSVSGRSIGAALRHQRPCLIWPRCFNDLQPVSGVSRPRSHEPAFGTGHRPRLFSHGEINPGCFAPSSPTD